MGKIRERIKRLPTIGPALHGLYLRSFYREGEILTIENGPLAGRKWKRFMRTYQDDYVRGTYEKDVQDEIGNHLREGMVFYDIGANAGFFSLLAASLVGPSGHVVAFEPHPQTMRQLIAQIELNGVASRVSAFTRAVSDSHGASYFDDSGGSVFGSMIERPTPNSIIVRTTPLDAEIAFGLPAPDMIKIDVEGAEMKVLAGAQMLLNHKRPILVVELHSEDLLQQYLDHISGLGYETRMVRRHAISMPPN
jgi:FkbM family methyltransferase